MAAQPSASNSRQNGKPWRLQIFVNDLGATGVVRNAVGIANAAADGGFMVRLLTNVPEGALRGELGQAVEVIGLLPPELAGRTRKKQLRGALSSYRRLTRDWRPDVLFSAGNHGHLLSTFAWLGMPGRKVLRISNDLERKTGKPPLLNRMLRAAKFRMITGRADRIVLVSHALARQPLLAGLVKNGKAEVIPNGVDVDRVRGAAKQICPHPWLRDGQVPVLLAVGRHAPQKNFETLLRAFAAARAHAPMRLLFLGAGEESAIAMLRSMAEAEGVSADVGFEPPTANPFSYMASAKAVALPSWWEGSANVLLESLACGTPVLASKTAGDAALVLDEGRYGVLFDPSDPMEMASAILRQLGPEPVRPGDRALSFSREAALQCYVRLFRECVGLQPTS